MLGAQLILLLLGVSALPGRRAVPQDGCELLVYKNVTQEPVVEQDTRGICPIGNGPRAFLPVTLSHFMTSNHAKPAAAPSPITQLKEVAPDPHQEFRCLTNSRCYLVVRGFGVGVYDAVAVLPKGQTSCPPTDVAATREGEASSASGADNEDVSVVVQSEHAGTLTNPNYDGYEASFAGFAMPDRFTLEEGEHTICYAPRLASRIKDLDSLSVSHFHYHAGTLRITNALFDCDFETKSTQGTEADPRYAGNATLPCGFRNFQDRLNIGLQWQLGQGKTETPGTGPDGDATLADGSGRYLYMDAPGFASGAAATVVSPPIAASPGLYCVRFAYSMYGPDVSTFRAYVHALALGSPAGDPNERNSSSAGVPNTMLGLWGTPRWVAVGNKGDGWHQGGFEFRSSQLLEPFELVFEAIAGESEQGDIAVDDISVTSGRCPMDVRSHVPRSYGNSQQPHQPMICGEVRLNTGLHAEDKSWRVEGAVSCAGRGYSLDQMNNSVWLPCCVPHFGAYTLILQDKLGDGWTGSQLEFRFFDRVMVFGNDDDFKRVGLDRSYTLVIGSLEIADILHPTENTLSVRVRVARPNSYAWCGVVQAAKDGRALLVDLTPQLLKTYGVRSSAASATSNDVLTVPIPTPLQLNADYDLYCYSEVIGDMLGSDVTLLHDEEKEKKEILASRLRVTMDNTPPTIMITSLYATHDAINVTFTVNENAEVWCLAEKAPLRTNPLDFTDPLPLFASGGALAETLTSLNPAAAAQRVARYFKSAGTNVALAVRWDPASGIAAPDGITSYITLSGLVPGTDYDVLCYAEDDAEPDPNVMSPAAVQGTARPTRTESKTPSVTIWHHLTLLKGFRLFVTLDAPGQVWCAAAPSSYGTPDVTEVVRAGAHVNSTEPFKDVILDIRGVEPNTAYRIFCVAGILTVVDPYTELQQLTSQDAMQGSALSVISYGRYCDTNVNQTLDDGGQGSIVTEEREITPFHPIRTDEEIRIREFILSRPELDLQGVYRITLLPNKTEIYNFYDNNGPKPLRYARVRAGRCSNGVGYYEQLRVGPLNARDDAEGQGNPVPLSYQRLARPIETECGGYNPQGVFGRRRRRRVLDSVNATDGASGSTATSDDDHEIHQHFWAAHETEFYNFMETSFGYTFPGLNSSCPLSIAMRRHSQSEDAQQTNASRTSPCLEYGPVILEEVCRDPADSHCTHETREGRVWLGLKTPRGERLPFYFIYNLTSSSLSDEAEPGAPQKEMPHAWAKRIVQQKELPEDFHRLWEASLLWYDGKFYDTIPELLEAVRTKNARQFSPPTFRDHRDAMEQQLREQLHHEHRRQLAPMPYPGAAGTAGPLPSREKRRNGLERLAHPEHVESQGSRFRVKASTDLEAYTITYAGWSMTVTNDRDTGLRIYNLRFLDKRVAFEMGVMEALAHYTVSERNWFFLDSWYGGLGSAARKVHKGIECPKTAVTLFWDGSLCVFEQDLARPLRSHWRGGELRLGAPHTALVIRQMITVSNYDYVTDYRFHMTGMMDASVSFTGELYAGVEVPWYSSRQQDYGTQVTGAMRFAALHAHALSWKIDFDVGENDNWKRNSVLLTQVVQDPKRAEANKLVRFFAEHERDAAYFRNDTRQLVYEVVDEALSMFGNTGGWRVMPFEGLNPLNHKAALYSGPAAWAKYRATSTVHKYSELDITLPRDNKFAHRPAISLDRYIEDNEPIRHADLVTWISDGIFHVPVAEDMPLTIPIGNTLGWLVKPSNLFIEDPSMDLHNAQGGGVRDPGTCAVVRLDIGEVEPTLDNTWEYTDMIIG